MCSPGLPISGLEGINHNKTTMEYIKKEDVERILFKIIRESTASDIKKYINNMSELELEKYKKEFVSCNFPIERK